jgi:hypothetical protein
VGTPGRVAPARTTAADFARHVDRSSEFAITARHRINGGKVFEEQSRFSFDLLEETAAGDKDFWTRQVVQALRDLKPKEAQRVG